MRVLHSLTIVLLLAFIIGLLASFGSQSNPESHHFTGIIQDKAPIILLE